MTTKLLIWRILDGFLTPILLPFEVVKVLDLQILLTAFSGSFGYV